MDHFAEWSVDAEAPLGSSAGEGLGAFEGWGADAEAPSASSSGEGLGAEEAVMPAEPVEGAVPAEAGGEEEAPLNQNPRRATIGSS